jgi:RNA recognition motif-containing protein
MGLDSHVSSPLTMSQQPNTTLYINNLNDKITKEDLKLQLHALFNTYGRLIDIVASKHPRMRGQAFLVFADLAGATTALRACEGMIFYDKPMVRLFIYHPISVLIIIPQANHLRQNKVIRHPLTRRPKLCPPKRKRNRRHIAERQAHTRRGQAGRRETGKERKVGGVVRRRDGNRGR